MKWDQHFKSHQLSRTNQGGAPSFSLSTIHGHDFVFQCVTAEDFHELVSYMLDGLKKRSQYVIALQDYSPPGVLQLYYILNSVLTFILHARVKNFINFYLCELTCHCG
jgi:hypothetical protein